MNPVAASIVGDQGKQRRNLLKKDWSLEEKAWRDNLADFLKSIEGANKLCEHGKTEEKKKDEAEKDVIINHEAGEPVVGSSAKEAEIPQIPQDDGMTNLDEFFGAAEEPPKKPTAKEEPTKEPSKAEASEVFASAGKESKVDFPPSEEKKPAPEPKPEPKPKPKPAPKVLPKKADNFCEGFDEDTFREKVMSVVNSILEGVPQADLDHLAGSVDEYKVEVSVDAYRSDMETIASKIAEVQAKRDSIIGPLTKLSSQLIAFDETLDFAVNVGVSCSAASNKERRVAEVHAMVGTLFRDFVRIKSLHEVYDKTHRHLGAQMDALSRLLTAQIERAKQVYLGSQREQEFRKVMEPHDKGFVSRGDTDSAMDLDQEVERMSQEVESQNEFKSSQSDTESKPTQAKSNDGLEGLESFSAAPTKKKEVFKKGIQPW